MTSTIGVKKIQYPNGTDIITLDSDGSLTKDTNTLHVDASNNRVGIGTTSPSQALHVAGGNPAGIIESTTSSGAFLQFKNTSSTGTNRLGYAVHDFVVDTNGTERMRIDANGHCTMPTQSAFSAGRSSTLSNFAINSMVTINLNSEIYDQNGDFSDPNFTAPVTGKYQLSAIWYMNALDISANYYILQIATSNRNYDHVVDSSARDEDETYSSYTLSILADMDAGDTASIGLFQQSGAAQTDITAGTYFTGYLVA